MFSGNDRIPVTNRSLELQECRDAWFLDERYDCWCLEDVLYTDKALAPMFQRLSVYAPKAYMKPDGTPDREGKAAGYTCATVPIVFVNNAAGYMQMPHTWLGDHFPREAETFAAAYDVAEDTELAWRRYLINPMNFIDSEERSTVAGHFRIRVGAADADTSLTIAMTLAVRLANAGIDSDFAFVWDRPHCDADYPGELPDWIDALCKGAENG